MGIINQGIDENDGVCWLEFETVEIGPQAACCIDDVGDHAVDLIAISLLGEFVAKALHQFARCFKPLGPAGEK